MPVDDRDYMRIPPSDPDAHETKRGAFGPAAPRRHLHFLPLLLGALVAAVPGGLVAMIWGPAGTVVFIVAFIVAWLTLDGAMYG